MTSRRGAPGARRRVTAGRRPAALWLRLVTVLALAAGLVVSGLLALAAPASAAGAKKPETYPIRVQVGKTTTYDPVTGGNGPYTILTLSVTTENKGAVRQEDSRVRLTGMSLDYTGRVPDETWVTIEADGHDPRIYHFVGRGTVAKFSLPSWAKQWQRSIKVQVGATLTGAYEPGTPPDETPGDGSSHTFYGAAA